LLTPPERRAILDRDFGFAVFSFEQERGQIAHTQTNFDQGVSNDWQHRVASA
jgi:hypothetical protein